MDLDLGMQGERRAYTTFTLVYLENTWKFSTLMDCRLAGQALGSGTGMSIAGLMGC